MNEHFSFSFLNRDVGIVINISILQWSVEVGNLVFYVFYIHFIALSYSDVLDKFFTLYQAFFTLVILPAFYLNGDSEFRTDLASNGYLVALKKSLFPSKMN